MTKFSLTRWLKTVLSLSGIDTKVFSAHSYRGASLSSAYNNGVSLDAILKAGDWTNADTLVNQFYAYTSYTPVGQMILNEYHLKVNISCVKIFDFDMIYSTNLYFNLPFGFANPATQV